MNNASALSIHALLRYCGDAFSLLLSLQRPLISLLASACLSLSLFCSVLFCFVCTWCAIRSGATNWLKGRLTVYQGAIQKRERSIASLPVSNIPIRECAHQAVGSRLWRFRLVIENQKSPRKSVSVSHLLIYYTLTRFRYTFGFIFEIPFLLYTRVERMCVLTVTLHRKKNPMPARHIFASFLFNFLSDVTPFPSLL